MQRHWDNVQERSSNRSEGSSLEASEKASLGSPCGASHPQQLPLTGSRSNSGWIETRFLGFRAFIEWQEFKLKQIFWCQKLTVWCSAVHSCSFLSVFAITLSTRSNIASIQVYMYCVSQL